MRKHMLRGLAVAVAGALALAPIAVSADDDSPAEESKQTRSVMQERAEDLAEESGLPVDVILEGEVTLTLPDGQGGSEEVTVSIGDVFDRIAGDSELEDGPSGFAGTPWANAGNVMHVSANLQILGAALVGNSTVVPPIDPEVVDAAIDANRPYSVVESDWTPDTPIVPVINPLLLAGALADVPVDLDDPLNLPLLLVTHWGGKLKSIQGGDWNMLGAHSAGSHLIGTNLDTAERPEEDEAYFPFYAPIIDEGELMVADESIDFLGFAQVVNESTCTRSETPVGSFLKAVTDICLGVGLVLGDGVSFFNGEGPIDLREDLAPLWTPAPEELAPVLEAVDEVVGQIPVDEVLEQVLEAVGGVDLPDTGDIDPQDPEAGTGTDDPDPDAGSAGNPVTGLLGSLLG